MKHIRRSPTGLVAGLAALFALACASSRDAPEPSPSSSAPAPSPAARAAKESNEAIQAIRDAAFAQRAALVAETRRELDAIRAEEDRLAAKVDATEGQAKAEARADLEVVRAKWAATKDQLDRVESATEDTWADAKDDLTKARADLKAAVDKSRRWLSDKISP